MREVSGLRTRKPQGPTERPDRDAGHRVSLLHAKVAQSTRSNSTLPGPFPTAPVSVPALPDEEMALPWQSSLLSQQAPLQSGSVCTSLLPSPHCAVPESPEART